MQSITIFHLSVFSSGIGLIVSVLLYFVNRLESFHARLLAFSLFTISVTCLAYGFYFSDLYIQFPHLWRTPVFFTLCTQPFTYFYIRSVINQEYRLKRSDLLFIVPAFLYTFNYLPFYFLSADAKLLFIKNALNDTSLIAHEKEAWVQIPGAVMIRLGYGIALLSLGLHHILSWKNSFKNVSFKKQNNDLFRWLLFYTTIIFSTYIFLFVEYIFHFFQFTEAYGLFTLTVSVTIILVCVYMLIRPNILYGASGWTIKNSANYSSDSIVDVISPVAPNRLSISYDLGRKYKSLLEDHLTTAKPFQKQGYSIRDLSLELNIPTYQLSVFINQEYSKNFNELINEYRINFVHSLLNDREEYKNYTLDALSKLAGFNSRSSFITAVKKYSGQTPSAFFLRK